MKKYKLSNIKDDKFKALILKRLPKSELSVFVNLEVIDCLSRGFIWTKTKEGWLYWKNTHSKLFTFTEFLEIVNY